MDYKVITAMNPFDLETLMRGYLADGWKPTGGVSVVIRENKSARNPGEEVHCFYYQAIYNESPDHEA